MAVSRSTCPPLPPFPHANSFVIGTAVINTHTHVNGESRKLMNVLALQSFLYLIVNKLLSHTHTESIRINKCSKRRYGERRKRDKDNNREVTWDFRMGFVFTTSAVGLFSADKTFIGANDLLSLH